MGNRMAVQPLPHRYQANASATPEGDVILLGDGLRALRSQPPVEFGGPGDRWSPETLLVAAVADCFALTFRAAASAAALRWESLECEADAVLDRVGGATQFTAFRVRAYLTIPARGREEDARRVLAAAKSRCLVTNSFKASCQFDEYIQVLQSTEAA
jgi:organic hydroperoxide reductase OsmC/OhrA